MPSLTNGLGGTDGFGTNALATGSASSAYVPLTVNFFGTSYAGLYINTDGTVTFGAAESYRIDAVSGNTGRPIIAPFSLNNDTSRGTGTSTGGTSTGADEVFYYVDNNTSPNLLIVTWDDVVEANGSPPGNAYQLIMVKDGPNAGDFDFEIRYESLYQPASFDPNSQSSGKYAGQAGYSGGSITTSYQLPDSNGNANTISSLVNDSNVATAGVYQFYVRSGLVYAAPSYSIAAQTPTQNEGNGGSTAFTFLVSRSGYTAKAGQVDWSIVNNTTDANDFTGAASGTVNFSAGETSKVITVYVNGDTIAEPDEVFNVLLSNARISGGVDGSAAQITTASAAAQIVNDDTSLRIDGANFSDKEGDSGTTDLTFTVTRNGILTGASSATWTVTGSNSTPAGANDFVGGVFPSGTVSFAAGESSKTITIPVQGDTTYEPDETFNVTLSNATGATISNATAGGTIQNDDSQISIGDPGSFHYFEGNSGQTTDIQYTVTRIGDTSQSQSVTWKVSHGATNPVSGADFVGGSLPTGTVTFDVGQTTATITIPVHGDNTIEPDENFVVTLSDPTNGANIGTASNTGAIVADDTGLAIAAAGDVSHAEGTGSSSTYTFTVTRSGYLSNVYPGTAPTTVHWSVTGTGAAPADANDFVGDVLPSGTLSFAAGETTKTITVNVNGDTTVEPTEFFTVTLSGAGGDASNTVITTATADGTIVNDDTKVARSDFNGDADTDILMTDPTTGQLLIWEMDGTTRLASSGKTSSAPGTNYTIVGTGDFNGDGKADILMQDQSTGHTTIWEMDGTTRLPSSGQAGSNQGAAYKALGAADFDGDGKADILWENTTTGQVSVWLMNGTTKLSGANVGAPFSSDWSFAGTGDFDGDGKADIVFQNNTTGAVKIWLMDGTTKVGGGTLAGTSGAGHQIVGIGDFDGDGKSDLLWETTSTTALSIWFMDGMTRTSHDSIGDAVAGHQVVSVGDYNGDGMSDILLQTTSSGHLNAWLMDGTTKLPASGSVSSNPGTTWHVVSS